MKPRGEKIAHGLSTSCSGAQLHTVWQMVLKKATRWNPHRQLGELVVSHRLLRPRARISACLSPPRPQ